MDVSKMPKLVFIGGGFRAVDPKVFFEIKVSGPTSRESNESLVYVFNYPCTGSINVYSVENGGYWDETWEYSLMNNYLEESFLIENIDYVIPLWINLNKNISEEVKNRIMDLKKVIKSND